MIRLRAEIKTNSGSIFGMSMEISLLQSVLTGNEAYTDPLSSNIGGFSGSITAWEKSEHYCSLVFRLWRIVLVPLFPQIPSGCHRDVNVTSLIPEVELTLLLSPLTESPAATITTPVIRSCLTTAFVFHRHM